MTSRMLIAIIFFASLSVGLQLMCDASLYGERRMCNELTPPQDITDYNPSTIEHDPSGFGILDAWNYGKTFVTAVGGAIFWGSTINKVTMGYLNISLGHSEGVNLVYILNWIGGLTNGLYLWQLWRGPIGGAE